MPYTYAASTKLAALGITATFAAASIGKIIDFQPAGLKAETKDATNQSTAGHVKDFLAGLIDAGEVSAKIEYDPATVPSLGVKDTLVFIIPTGSATTKTWTMTAIFTEWQPASFKLGDGMEADVKFKVCSLPVVT